MNVLTGVDMSEITNKELANLLFGMSECNVLPNTTLRQLKLAAERLAAMPDVSGQEPAAHMFPDDIERFQKQETFANAYSVEMISPDKGKTVPLYTKQPAPDEETIKRYCTEFCSDMMNGDARKAGEYFEVWWMLKNSKEVDSEQQCAEGGE